MFIMLCKLHIRITAAGCKSNTFFITMVFVTAITQTIDHRKTDLFSHLTWPQIADFASATIFMYW